MAAVTLLRSASLTVTDYRCSRGPHDRPYPEQYASFCVAYVRRGSFGYRWRGQDFELVAGSVLIGRPGDEYICSHDHHRCGDECLAFSFGPELADTIGAGAALWRTPCLPPAPAAMVFGELAQVAADGGNDIGLDEAALLFAAACGRVVSPGANRCIAASARDRRRMVEAALWLDANAQDPIDLASAAQVADLSPYHFLRLFSRVLGVTPHQYLVRARLRRGARLLAGSSLPITEVAFDAGFADLSNFVRTFHRAAGVSPREFRRAANGNRKIFQESAGLRSVG